MWVQSQAFDCMLALINWEENNEGNWASAVVSLGLGIMLSQQVFFLSASNQIYLVTLRPTQLTQASFLQKNQMLQNGFLIFLTLR